MKIEIEPNLLGGIVLAAVIVTIILCIYKANTK